MSDWRLQGQERYLKGAQLSRQSYNMYRGNQDHDHCAFCWKKFTAIKSDEDSIQAGYVTGDHYHWICDECFNDFRLQFEWTIVGESE